MSVLDLRGVSKTYGQGVAEVHALSDVNLSVDAGAMVAVMGAERLGQVHAADHRRQPGGPHQRGGTGRRHRTVRDVAQ
jgi:hypothetical protein